jgi:ElaB/YqjD/DUF883 family membrane-anchored ribosome-binding protein
MVKFFLFASASVNTVSKEDDMPVMKEEACCSESNTSTEVARKAGQKLREVIDMAGDEARDVRASAIKQVRQRPLQTSVIAAGVGLLAGLLLGRR